MLNCLHQVLRNDLRFALYCSGSKMLKNRSKQNSYHACNFIHNHRETWFCLEHLSHTCKNAMLSPPTKTKVEVNDEAEGSLHSFSICMHDMKNLQKNWEWIAGTQVVLMWTLTLKSKIGSPSPPAPHPLRHVSHDLFFPLKHWDRSRFGSLYHY